MAKLASEKISVSMVARAIGRASLDVGTLCTCDSVNKWSYCKPIHVPNVVVPLTDAQIKQWHYGLVAPIRALNTWSPDSLIPATSEGEGYSNTLENVKKFTTWKYEPAEKGNTGWATVYGKPNLENPDSEGNISPARLSDFAGYDHRSKPIFYSDEGFVYDGNNLTIKVKTYIPEDGDTTYGGLTVNNFYVNGDSSPLSDYYLQAFLITKEAVDNPTVGMKTVRYALGHTDLNQDSVRQAITDAKTEYEFKLYENGALQLLGDFYYFIAIVKDAVKYELTGAEVVDGTNTFEDSWKDTAGRIFYPKMTTTSSMYLLENLVYELNIPSGEGSIIRYNSENGAYYGQDEDGNYVYDYNKDYSEITRYSGTSVGDSYVTLSVNGLDIIPNEDLFKECRSKKRCISFADHLSFALSGRDSSYLNRYEGYNTGGNLTNPDTVGWVKPLLRNVYMFSAYNNETFWASFYLKYFKDSSDEIRSVVVMRVFDNNGYSISFGTENGVDVYTKEFGINLGNYLWGHDGTTNWRYRYISFGNKVSSRNQAYSSVLTICVDQTENTSLSQIKKYEYDLTFELEGNTYYPIIASYLQVDEDGDGNLDTTQYGNIEIRLPESLEESSSGYGGKCSIHYSVNDYDFVPPLGMS